MITLFNIPDYTIKTCKFNHFLHGSVVKQFEEAFAEYVGAKYACFANSASSLIYLSLLGKNKHIRVPSVMPIVVPNMIINSGNKIHFYDDVDWVGGAYKLDEGIWDSAQQVTRNQYANLGRNDDVMIFSFYPTKPVSGCDGGMVVSNNKDKIENYKIMINNGCTLGSSWENSQRCVGYKMHGNSIQAYIAYQNLKKLDKKNKRLSQIRKLYNDKLGCKNSSGHLYRIRVNNNKAFVDSMRKNKIQCGIHYSACHNNPLFIEKSYWTEPLLNSEKEERQTVSIPFHEKLSTKNVNEVISNVKKLRLIH